MTNETKEPNRDPLLIASGYYSYKEVLTEANERLKKLRMTSKQKTMKYKFKVSSTKAVDLELIAQDCTRKNPLVFATVGEDEFVFVHTSLFNKFVVLSSTAALLPHTISSSSYANCVRFSIKSIKHRPLWVAWARNVRYASWPDEEVVVHVTIPNI